MGRFRTGTTFVWWILAAVGATYAADYRVEMIQEGPGAGVSEEIAKLLAPAALRVYRGTRPQFDFWLCRELSVSSFQPQGDVQFPLAPGQLVGVIRVHRKTTDFRGQDVEPGTYILRFGLQPVDGAHVGTSPTRDFLLLLPAERDRQPDPLNYEMLTKWSAEVAGTNHPCLLSLQLPVGEESVRHVEDRDWWLVRLQTLMTHQGQTRPLVWDVVVEGRAES